MAGDRGGEKWCLYEVLGVGSDSSPEDIHVAYKRLALQHHPDRAAAAGIPTETSTARFQEIFNAYEVLSDPNECASYDSRRSQTFSYGPGPSPGATSTRFSDRSSNPRPSFGATDACSNAVDDLFRCFDSEEDFYEAYGGLFEKIYHREVEFARKMGMGEEAVREPPAIGSLDSPYAQVTAFYRYWMEFCTVLDFAWLEYEPEAGLSRKVRRAMEEENRKLRRKARRKYNAAVRGLAVVVRQRDERVIEMVARRRADEKMRKAREEVWREAKARRGQSRLRPTTSKSGRKLCRLRNR